MPRSEDAAAPLAALRADLLRGDFAGLDAHLAAIVGLGADIERDPATAEDLDGIRAEAERSRDLLAAAAGGVRAALRRLGEAGAPTAVYAPDGNRLVLGEDLRSRESRA